jgi:hypothetical protein
MTRLVLSLTIRGWSAGTRQGLADALVFATNSKVKADIELQPNDQEPGGISFKQRSEFAGRKEFSRS